MRAMKNPIVLHPKRVTKPAQNKVSVVWGSAIVSWALKEMTVEMYQNAKMIAHNMEYAIRDFASVTMASMERIVAWKEPKEKEKAKEKEKDHQPNHSHTFSSYIHF